LAVSFEQDEIKQRDILRTNIFPVTHLIELITYYVYNDYKVFIMLEIHAEGMFHYCCLKSFTKYKYDD